MFTNLLRNTAVGVRQNVSISGANSIYTGRVGGTARGFKHSRRRQAQLPQLSPYDVNLILYENEFMHTFVEEETPLRSYETNMLSSNNPCEDTRSEGTFLHKNGFICGVFDGHGGPACSQVVSKRLLRYLGATLIDRKLLNEEITKSCTSQSFLKCHNDKVDFVKDIKVLYEKSFAKYIHDKSSQETQDLASEMESAFEQLDSDLSHEALTNTNARTMAVAMSGVVACVAHIEHLDVHVAGVGDVSAVLGSQCSKTGQWQSKKLTNEHNSDNLKEVKRILDQHPVEEQYTAIRNDRLLGQLAPLRALGDFRYKWSNEIMRKYVIPSYGEMAVPPHYYTPPYLTARPEVMHHRLTPEDKFMVIASDGLWDFLSPSQVVSLVGDHLNSKKVLGPLRLPESDDVTLGQVSDILAKRKAGRARKPLDQNAATHLIRHALGGTEYGIEHSKIAYYLSLPQEMVRLYRDDITITVLYFNSEYVENNGLEG